MGCFEYSASVGSSEKQENNSFLMTKGVKLKFVNCCAVEVNTKMTITRCFANIKGC